VQEWNPTGNIAANTFTTMLIDDDHGAGAEEFQIAFVFDGYTFNINNWNIDDIMLYMPEDRALENYKVWLDGIFVADVETEFYQYDVSTLVQGQTYLTEVAAVYTGCISAKMAYEWTFYPCELFPGPEGLFAEIIDINNVRLD
jgi:hypothetical protein